MSAERPTVRTALLSPPFSELNYGLPEYLPQEAFFVGQRVIVPLGNGRRAGVISAFERTLPDSAAGATPKNYTLKNLVWPLDRERLLSPAYLDLARTMAVRHADDLGRILGGMLPAGLRSAGQRLRFFDDGGILDLHPADLVPLPADRLRVLGELWMAGRAEVRRPGTGRTDSLLYFPASDPPWPVRPAAKARLAVLEFLLEKGPASRRALLNALGKKAGATLTALVRDGLARAEPADPADPESPEDSPLRVRSPEADTSCFSLTPRQQAIFDELLRATGEGAQSRLLFGVTGSGKTAVYLELARAVIASGRSVLLLAPEVALALKLRDDAEAALPPDTPPPDRRHLFHGYQSAASRERAFRLLAGDRSGRPRLLVGTRSALLLPLENIGLIVMDEEHDSSFKQDEGFINYQAKEVAWYRAHREGALLLLGSATPDLKSFYAARQGRIPLHTLNERFGGSLPEARIVSLNSGYDAEKGLLAPDSTDALNDVVKRGEQAVILLNRRGYAPVVYCRDCRKTLRCPQCDISLAYHKGREKLVCHYCGGSTPFPSPCPSCGGLNFLPMGEGTEKLEESLESLLPPGAGILRLDRDSTRRPGRMEAILSAFARKEASVLVGTQMLSKGHHFPDVTLAIIADADLGLNLPDYRAAERTFQLILQASGRSGRGGKSGTVLIQTRDPGHYCWEYVLRADYEGFFERELELRRRRLYPPFTRLALIRISHEAGLAEGAEAATALGRSMRQKAGELGVAMLGPAPAPLPLLKGRMRRHCLLKGDNWQNFRLLYNYAEETAANGPLTLRLDLDPVNML